MADEGISVTATNGAAFDAALGAMVKDLQDLSGPLQAAGKALAQRAQAAAPRRTGRLAGSHRVLPKGPRAVTVEADTPYAAVIHWGWPGHGISRQPWLVATYLRDPVTTNTLAEGIQANLDRQAART